MGLFVTDENAGYVHSHAAEIDRKLREGDGIHWTGDPRLHLEMGILTAPRRMFVRRLGRWVNKGDIVARRYEVRRWCEDGTDQIIRTYRLEEIDRIFLDLAPLRMDSPRHVDTIEEIDKANDELDRENNRKLRESLMEGFEHALKLHHDTTQPKNVFRGIPGLKDTALDSGGGNASD